MAVRPPAFRTRCGASVSANPSSPASVPVEDVCKLSIVGVGMRSHSGVAAKLFDSLAAAGVNIEMISTSEIKISVVIDLAKGDAAMKAVHGAFLG